MEQEINKAPSRIQQLLYGETMKQKIQNSNILVVGVGGIGCELLKCLTKAGFRKFTIIDLDTIEFSNLNRQFYFRKQHVKRSKAEVGKEKILEICPDCDIEAYCENLFDPKFDNKFYQSFTLVFNALDNQEARRYLGRKCIENGKVMIDAGTSGYNGQAQTNIRHINLCNNCKPPIKQQVFNVCSIRDQPSEPIHCVVWSKNLYNMVFGKQENTDEDKNNNNIEEEKEDKKEQEQEQSEDKQLLESGTIDGVFEKQLNLYEKDDFKTLGVNLFNKVFGENIKLRQSNNGIEEEESNQNSLKLKNNKQIKIKSENSKSVQHIYPLFYEKIQQQTQNDKDLKQSNNNNNVQDERVKSIKEYAQEFVQNFIQVMDNRKSELGSLQYDKDDILAHTFVAAATNLRIHNFRNPNNPQKMVFISARKIKEMNIIHAIGSTNAIVAACQVTECLKILSQKKETVTYIKVSNGKSDKLNPCQLMKQQKANLECEVCSYKVGYIQMQGNIRNINLKKFREIMEDHFNVPSKYRIYCNNTKTCVYEHSDNKLRQNQYESISEKPLEQLLENIPNLQSIEFQVESEQFTWKVQIQVNNKIDGLQVFTSPTNILDQFANFKKKKYEEQNVQKSYLYSSFGY